MAKAGRPHGTKKIETPEKLWDLFTQYVSCCEDEPYLEQNWVGRDGEEVYRKIMKHVSFDGFEGWLAERGELCDLGQYAANRDDRYKDYVPIITRIRKVCRGKLLTAAISNVANANVVSRYLGLKEAAETELTIKDYEVTLNL